MGGTAVIAPSEDNINDMLLIGTPTVASGGWGYDIPFSMKFTHAAMINNAELTALFDVYKIVGVKVFVTYNHNVSTASGTSGMPSIIWWPDPDNAAVETVTDIRERMGLIRKPYTSDKRTRVLTLRYPKKMAALFDQATGALNVSQPIRGWTDCDDVNIPHYGIKGMLENVQLPTTAGTSFFKFDVQLMVQYKFAR